MIVEAWQIYMKGRAVGVTVEEGELDRGDMLACGDKSGQSSEVIFVIENTEDVLQALYW